MQSWIFLGLILLIACVARNSSLIFATVFVLALKAVPAAENLIPIIEKRGIDWGVTVISVAILIPIATGKINFQDLLAVFKSPAGWIGVGCGILVAVLAKNGVGLLATSPQITVALLVGTIIGVIFLQGIAAGPVIASGIVYCIFSILQFNINS
jgi:uncharacterized membrane protein (DUF441 family)